MDNVLTKKQKKAFDAAKKRKLYVLRLNAKLQREVNESAVAADYELFERQQIESRAQRKKLAEEEQPWTARTQMIRNKLTNQRRQSMDRWNRFAGTEDAGAMGR